ncbi:chromobox protein homolog 1-like [Drosophila obscura]|uniref:chromobox protein homolog 1-like n=1 Tax=Drosophila obscura TaxID=7282 RepID=UPI001BB28026|nr:chromobox protein homolog 1-like [Drosophila obscura]
MTSYVVHRVEDKRFVNGRTEYFLRWRGYPASENTWEPAENLDCPALIAKYEKSVRLQKKQKKKKQQQPENRVATVATPENVRSDDEPGAMNVNANAIMGFDRGLKPAKILAATDALGELMFLVKWVGCDQADLVPAKLANERCPQVVIAFYEERIAWQSENFNGDDGADSYSSD